MYAKVLVALPIKEAGNCGLAQTSKIQNKLYVKPKALITAKQSYRQFLFLLYDIISDDLRGICA
jgi:hypothetical protein